MVDTPHTTRTGATYQLQQRQILVLLSAGQDPLRIFAKMPKSDKKIAIYIYNKHVEEPLKDL